MAQREKQMDFFSLGKGTRFEPSATIEGDKQALIFQISKDKRFSDLIKPRAILMAETGKYKNTDEIYLAIIQEDLEHSKENKVDQYPK